MGGLFCYGLRQIYCEALWRLRGRHPMYKRQRQNGTAKTLQKDTCKGREASY